MADLGTTLRGEMKDLGDQLRGEIKDQSAQLDSSLAELATHMRVLHDVIGRIAPLQEGMTAQRRPPTRKRKQRPVLDGAAP